MKSEKHKVILWRNGKRKIDWLWFWREWQYIKDDVKWFKRRFFPVYCEQEWSKELNQWHCKNCGYNIHTGKCRE